jgi:hypothetical protein
MQADSDHGRLTGSLRRICGGPPKSRECGQTASRQSQCFREFWPVFAGLRGSLTNRGARIRTGDLADPNGARYQAAPRPDANTSIPQARLQSR